MNWKLLEVTAISLAASRCHLKPFTLRLVYQYHQLRVCMYCLHQLEEFPVSATAI